MADFHHGVVMQLAEIARQALGNMIRVGTVHEVKGDKLRMVVAIDRDGKEILSPWIHTGNTMRGGARERRFFKKGQSLAILMPTGDPRQGILLPYAPNKNFLAPDHANKSGQDEEVYQLDDLRVRKRKDGYEIWLQAPKSKSSQQGDLKKMPEQQGDAGGQARMKLKIHTNGGITGRVGKMRFAAHKKGAKIKAEKDYAVVMPGKLIISRPWELGDDPIPDDDK